MFKSLGLGSICFPPRASDLLSWQLSHDQSPSAKSLETQLPPPFFLQHPSLLWEPDVPLCLQAPSRHISWGALCTWLACFSETRLGICSGRGRELLRPEGPPSPELGPGRWSSDRKIQTRSGARDGLPASRKGGCQKAAHDPAAWFWTESRLEGLWQTREPFSCLSLSLLPYPLLARVRPKATWMTGRCSVRTYVWTQNGFRAGLLS